jgi:hypothetical protein
MESQSVNKKIDLYVVILYPVRDVTLYGEYTPYPEGYEFVTNMLNFCDKRQVSCTIYLTPSRWLVV